jgi:hypothetical protein
MINRPQSPLTRSLEFMFLGALLVILGFTTYPIIAALEFAGRIGTEGFVVGYAYFALGLIILGLIVLFYGATNALTNWSTGETSGTISSISSTIATIFARPRYSRLLLASSLAYGGFYALASGVVVFQPAFSFSEIYHVQIPSLAIATCCGPVGETPEAVVYLTQHLGLLLIPINLLLVFSISWLVGLNASLATFSLSTRTKKMGLGWFGGIGAFIGLFTACPTCAGFAFLAMLGGTGSLSAAFFLGPLQTLLVGLSIPILAATPIVSARSICKLEGRACVNPQSS